MEQKQPKILIAIPSMDTVPVQFALSLATLRRVGNPVISFKVGSLVYTARNDLAKMALETEADFVFWLDSDMIFKPDTLDRMMVTMETKGLDFLSGLYFRRVTPYTPVLFKTLEFDEEKQVCSWTDFGDEDLPKDIFEVGGVGFGCVLMRTDVIFDVAAKYGDMFGPLAGVGEDLSFCWRARQCGYKIFVDPSVDLGHVGHMVVSREFFEAFRKSGGQHGN